MGAKGGRKSAYETRIKPRLSEISEWLANGATEKQIAHNLGIGVSTLEKYKASNAEFREFLKNGRRSLVLQLRGALVKKALGFDYTETTETKEVNLQTGELEVTKTEVKIKHAQPDVAALNLCLKNYDSDAWANDPQSLALKKEELEIKKKHIEKNDW